MSRPSYPSADEYQRALNTPANCFADADLRQGTPRVNRFGLPVVWSGQFATVFRLDTRQGARAVRCFTAQVSDHQARYAALHDHLARHRAPMLADFEYQPRGMRIAGEWLPMVKMEWVEGLPLDRVVEEAALAGDRKRLRDLAAVWSEMMQGLAQAGVTHGDLQHENILVQGAGSRMEMRLVDYDGVYVPALKGRTALEQGHPHYQHPARTRSEYGPHLDAFPALLILLSLRALADDPTLWRRHHSDKHLLLRSDDLRTPQRSPLLLELSAAPSDDVRRLTLHLVQACGLPSTQTPALIHGADGEAVGTGSAPRREWRARPLRRPRPVSPEIARQTEVPLPETDVDWRRTWQSGTPPAPGPAPSERQPAADRLRAAFASLSAGATHALSSGAQRATSGAQGAVSGVQVGAVRAWQSLSVAEPASPMSVGVALVVTLSTSLLFAGALGALGVSGYGLLATQQGALGRQFTASLLLGVLTPALLVASRRPMVALATHFLALALLIGASRPEWSPLLYAAASALGALAPLWPRRAGTITLRDTLSSVLVALMARAAVAALFWDESATASLLLIETAAAATAALAAIGLGKGLRALADWIADAMAVTP